MRLTGNPADAEDLLQEAYVRAYKFFHRYDDRLPFQSWLYRIMTNLHIDTTRKRNRMRTVSMDHSGPDGDSAWDLPDEGSSPELPLLEQFVEEPIQFALKAMNPDFRVAVLLADVEGMAYEEIADIMDVSVGTVRSRIHRGRKQLRDYLEKMHPEQFAGVGR